jgi:hypothetical protein
LEMAESAQTCSIPTLASIPNCEYSKGLRGKGVQLDTKTDTSFPAP